MPLKSGKLVETFLKININVITIFVIKKKKKIGKIQVIDEQEIEDLLIVRWAIESISKKNGSELGKLKKKTLIKQIYIKSR